MRGAIWSLPVVWGRITYCEGQYIGYYGTHQFFQDLQTGRFYRVDQFRDHPSAQPTWLHRMPPIHYLPHELSPMLKVLDDRVVEVTAMSTASPSYAQPEIGQPDIQVALMKTEKDTLLENGHGVHPARVPRAGPSLVSAHRHERLRRMETFRQRQALALAGRQADARHG